MKKSNAARGFRFGRPVLALLALSAGTAWAQMDMPALTYDVVEISYPIGRDPVMTRETHAMRRDGSTVVVTPVNATDGTTYELRRIQDLARGSNSQVNTGVRTVTTTPLRGNMIDQVRNAPERSCGAPMNAARVKVGDYYALRFTTVVDLMPNARGGEVQTERLVAPQLGCAALLTVIREGGGVRTIRQIENIRLGEPDPGLFIVPAGYREAPPAEREAD
jgi:hypothetical protein